jgi:hypothetical protein
MSRLKSASFSSFIFDPDDSVQQIVFQCRCGASIRADRKHAIALGWRRTWVPASPPPPLAAGEPPRPSGLLLAGHDRIWTCPTCDVHPQTESYIVRSEDAEQKRTHGLLLFPGHVIDVRPSSCTSPIGAVSASMSRRRARSCNPVHDAVDTSTCRMDLCGRSAGEINLLSVGVLLSGIRTMPRRSRRCLPRRRKTS